MRNRSLRGSTRQSRIATASAVAQAAELRALAESAITAAREARLQRQASIAAEQKKFEGEGPPVGPDSRSHADRIIDHGFEDKASMDEKCLGGNADDHSSAALSENTSKGERSPPDGARQQPMFLPDLSHSSSNESALVPEPVTTTNPCPFTAPTKNPTVGPSTNSLAAPAKDATDNKSNAENAPVARSTCVSAAFLIEEAVRSIYREVKRRRGADRKKLIKSVLKTSRDQVLKEASFKRKRKPRLKNRIDSEKNRLNDVAAADEHALAYHIGIADTFKVGDNKQILFEKKRKRKDLHFTGCNLGDTNLPTNHFDKKRMRMSSVFYSRTPHPQPPSFSCTKQGQKLHHSHSSSFYSNGSKSGRFSKRDANKNTTLNQAQTLLFPRLPSNDCPVHPFLSFPFCSPCMVDTGTREWKASTINHVTKGPMMNNLVTKPPGQRGAMSFDTPVTSKKITNPITPGAAGPGAFKVESSTDGSIPDPNTAMTAGPGSANAEFAVEIKLRGSFARSASNHATLVQRFDPPLLIEGTHPPRPPSTATIFLKSLFSVEDERNLAYIPYFGDDDKEDVVSELFNVEERQRLVEYGPPYRERETMETIDDMLKMLSEQDPTLFEQSIFLEGAMDSRTRGNDNNLSESDLQTLRRIITVISDLMHVKTERVRERCRLVFSSNEESNNSVCNQTLNKQGDDTTATNENHVQLPSKLKKNSETPVPISYADAMDSYRDLFCRRCFTYDCNLHGNIPKASLDLLGELAVQKVQEGHWNKLDKDIELGKDFTHHSLTGSISPIGKTTHSETEKVTVSTEESLDAVQQSIMERAFLVFQGDIGKISSAIGASPEAVGRFATIENLTLHPPRLLNALPSGRRKREKKELFKSMKNYNSKWLQRIENVEIHPAFIPCDHDEPCNDDTCSCVRNAFFCTKHCGWGSKSRNFFRGCSCKGGQCRSGSCACYAAKRECDPDLCRACGACTDPPNLPAGSGQRCRNDNLSMRRHAHLLLAESSIKDAGWGVYTKHALKRGDFVHEYVGEVISQEEAERRGRIYDKVNRSYLFNLSSDFVVDASRKGNKTKFANHSSKPNCETKMICVNGDIRIGLFAKEDIDAQSELFFDYRYDVHMDNDLIIKPAKNVDWMKNPKMANKISKKHA